MDNLKETLARDPMIGMVLGGTYRIKRKIGEGGMATVYAATHARIDRGFAIKILQIRAAQYPDMLQRFEREAKIGSQLGHDHIVQVFDFNRTPQGEPFLVMELLEGEDLGTILEQETALPLDWSIAVIRQAALALTAAHQHAVIHRDLKPENIFLCGQPRRRVRVKVMDFGISKILSSKSLVTRDSTIFGTPWYMAPEQAEGQVQKIDQRTDLYALGVLLYRMLGQKLPYDGQSIPTVLYKIVHDEPESLSHLQPSLSVDLVDIINKAMHKDPCQRFESTAQMMTALETSLRQGQDQSWDRVRAWGHAEEDRTTQVVWEEAVAEAAASPPAPLLSETLPNTAVEEETFSAQNRIRPWMILGLAAVVVAIGVAALFLGQPKPSDHSEAPVKAASPPPPDLAPRAEAPDLAPVQELSRLLSVTTTPAGATVIIDGTSAGKTPLKAHPISTASHTLTIKKRGHAPMKQEIPEGSIPQEFDLTLKPRPGSINVVALHKGKTVAVEIYLDGVMRDQTPAMIQGLKPGRYKLRLKGKGFHMRERTVMLKPGQRRREVFELRR